MQLRYLPWLISLAMALQLAAPAQAQDAQDMDPIRFDGPINVLPVVEPDMGIARTMPAETQIRIDYAGLRPGVDDDGNRGWQFYARSQCIIWTGLDRGGNPILFDRRNQSTEPPSNWAPLEGVSIHARAELRMIHSEDTLYSKNITFEGTQWTEFAFPLIPQSQRILPGMYQIRVTVYPARQRRDVSRIIWEEDEDMKEDGNGVFFFRRLNPDVIPGVSNVATIGVAGRNYNGVYVSMPMGGVASRERALANLDRYDEFERAMFDLEDREDRDEQEEMLLQIYNNEIAYMDKYIDLAHRFRDELDDIRDYETAVREAVSAYAREMAVEVEAFTVRLWQVSRQVYWMTNLCRPDFHLRDGASGPNPMNPYERMDYSVPEMRELFGIGNGRFLDAPPEAMRDRRNPTENDPITGAWHDEYIDGFDETPRRQWLNWMRDDWMPQVEELRDEFRRLFADPEAGIEWGILPDGESTYFAALWSDLIGDLGAAIDHLIPMAQASANRLAQIHTPEDETVRYPFADRRSGRPSPRPNAEVAHYRSLNNVLHRSISFFDIRLAPRVDSEEELEAELRRRRNTRADMGRPDWDGLSDQVDPGRYDPRNNDYFRNSDGLVIPRQVWENMEEDQREEYQPWCPIRDEDLSH